VDGPMDSSGICVRWHPPRPEGRRFLRRFKARHWATP